MVSKLTQNVVHDILKYMLTLDSLVVLHFWERYFINRVQKCLQDPKMNSTEAAADLDSLNEKLIDSYEKCCQEALKVGKNQCETWGLTAERKICQTNAQGKCN